MPLVQELEQLAKVYRFGYNKWLNVNQIAFGKGCRHSKLDTENSPLIKQALDELLKEYRKRWKVSPNVLYIQYNLPGPGVNRHRDPKSDLYGTTIRYCGEFTGGDFCVESRAPVSTSGGVCINLECTSPTTGQQGPFHWTTPITSGKRWSLILNHKR